MKLPKLSDRKTDFALHSLSQATGTVIGAAVIYLTSALVGIHSNVPLEAALVAIAIVLGGIGAAAALRRSQVEMASQRRRTEREEGGDEG